MGVLCFFKLSTTLKTFFGFVVCNTAIQIGLKALAFNGIENIWLINLSALSDLLFCYFFINSIYLKISLNKSINISVMIVFIYSLTNTFFGWGNIVKLTFLGSEFIALILVLSALVYCTKNFINTNHYLFLILIPFSLYLASVILVFLAFDIGIETKNQNLFVFYDYLFPIVNIMAYCCYAIAFYLDARPKYNPCN